MDTIIALFSIPQVQTVLLTILGSIASLVLGKFVTDAVKRAAIEKVITAGIPIAYHVVDEISRKTPNKIDDKVAAALGVLKDFVATHGYDPKEVTADHEARAKILFDALHAQDKKNQVNIEIHEAPSDAPEAPQAKA